MSRGKKSKLQRRHKRKPIPFGDANGAGKQKHVLEFEVWQSNMPQWLKNAEAAVEAGRLEEATDLLDEQVVENAMRVQGNGLPKIFVMFKVAQLLRQIGQLPRAEGLYKEILKSHPDPAAYNGLGLLYSNQGRLSKAITYFNEAIDKAPKEFLPKIWGNLASPLMLSGETEKAIESLHKVIEKTPHDARAYSNLLLYLHYVSDVDASVIFEESGRWARVNAPESLAKTSHENSPEPDRRLRIGYISPDFRTHSVSYFFEPFLDRHDRQVVEVYGYGNVAKPDQTTARLKAKFDHYRNISQLDLKVAAEIIEDDKIDVLVDLAGHTAESSLVVLAHKPAPIQVTYLGYPDTTGMSQVDYRLTDSITDPPGAQKYYTEELVFLPGGFLCYDPGEIQPPVGPLPALGRGYVTFCCFNDSLKINAHIMELWAEILKAVESSSLLLKFEAGANQEVCSRYLEHFEKLGIGHERLTIRGWLPSPAHLEIYNQVDIALDTYPYNGTTTTCQALLMGVPVISLFGERHFSRVGLSILSRLGLEFFAVSTPQEYIDKAVTLASKPQAIAKIRATVRQRMAFSGLCDAKAFVRSVETAYRKMWQRWCQSQGARPPVDEPGSEAEPTSACAAVPVSGTTETATCPQEQNDKKYPTKKPTIRIFHNLARAGGTLVCKCLGCMSTVVLLSEIHPLGTKLFNPLKQAHEWHKLLTPEDVRLLNAAEQIDFVDAIRLIEKRCNQRNKQFVIRDWAHLDFMAVPFFEKPGYRMFLVEALSPHFETVQLALARHPVDQWLSLSKLSLMQGKLNLEAFLKGYRKFAEQIVQTGFIRYEDFTADPAGQMKIICEKMQIDFNKSFLDNWYRYDCITGDTGGNSRGSKLRSITPLPRRSVEPELLRRFRESDDYRWSLELLDYLDIEERTSYVACPANISEDAETAANDGETTGKHNKREINAKRIFVSSMPRAGSMWAYNVTRQLIRSAGLKAVPQSIPSDTTPYISKAFNEPLGAGQIYCVKTHYVVNPPENDNNTLIIVPYRDVRDCIVSFMRFMPTDFEQALCRANDWMKTIDEYFARQTPYILKIRYDEIVSHPLEAIQKIDRFIGTGASFRSMEKINEQFSRERVKEKLAAFKHISMEQLRENYAGLTITPARDGSYRVFDTSTGFQTDHITSGKDGEWRNILSDEQKRILMQNTADWLEKYGFPL